MAFRFTFLLVLTLACAKLYAQPAHRLNLGWRASTFENAPSGFSLAYYRASGTQTAWGIKGTFLSGKAWDRNYYFHHHVFGINLVHQFRHSLGQKLAWQMEAGISGLAILNGASGKVVLECGTGLTAEEMRRLAANIPTYNKGYSETSFYPGLTLAPGLHYRLARHWGLGVEIMGDCYYTPDKKHPLSAVLSPAFLATYSF